MEAFVFGVASMMPAPVAFLGGSLQYFTVARQSETFLGEAGDGATAGDKRGRAVIPGRAQRELWCAIAHLRISRFPDVPLHIRGLVLRTIPE
jgi:hypothetical protein